MTSPANPVQRAAELFDEHERTIATRTDRLLARLLVVQWFAAMVLALWVSPRTWEGSSSSVHLHVWAAVLLGGLITAGPLYLVRAAPGELLTRHVVGLAQVSYSALLIHLTGGRIETHFHIFGSLAFLSFYRDWRVLVSASALVAVDHLTRGLFWPQSVFGVLVASEWRWVEHAGWVVFEDVFLVRACLQGRSEMREIARRRAELEATMEGIEQEVRRRTEERDAIQVRLDQARKLESVGQLAAGIAHEINTPTQYVGDNARFLKEGFADLSGVLEAYGRVADELRDQRPASEALAALDKQVDAVDPEYLMDEIPTAIDQSIEGIGRVANIVRAMKSFSHPGANSETRSLTRVDLNEAIRTTAVVCRNEWKYVARLQLDLGSGLEEVPCLPGEINQVLLNLIVNAAHAIGERLEQGPGAPDATTMDGQLGTIRIATRLDGDHARIDVSDDGTGMPEEVRARIFDPFFTTKEVGKGTGQGLAISHNVVVNQHGGRIEVDSTPGAGTTFSILLPLEAPSGLHCGPDAAERGVAA